MQVDLVDIQNIPGNQPLAADLLSSTALPLTPFAHETSAGSQVLETA